MCWRASRGRCGHLQAWQLRADAAAARAAAEPAPMTAPYLLALHSPAANRTLSTVMPTDWSVLVARFRTVHSADHRAEHLEHRRAAGAIGGGDGGRVAFGREGCNLLCWVLPLGSSSTQLRASVGGSGQLLNLSCSSFRDILKLSACTWSCCTDRNSRTLRSTNFWAPTTRSSPATCSAASCHPDTQYPQLSQQVSAGTFVSLTWTFCCSATSTASSATAFASFTSLLNKSSR